MDTPVKTIDTIGLYCPVPLFKAREGIDDIAVDEVLELLADDPAANEDIKRFAKRTGHEIIKLEEDDDGNLTFWIKRKK